MKRIIYIRQLPLTGRRILYVPTKWLMIKSLYTEVYVAAMAVTDRRYGRVINTAYHRKGSYGIIF
ncbi:MAG: hypothetical protein LUF33_03995 [Clostridiales bacterium]|nr:hypothetical protein [Clostridiales bacterium]